MNILSKVTWQSMWKNKTRTIVTIIGIVLSAAMFMAVFTLAFSLRDFMYRGAIYEQGDYYVSFIQSTNQQLSELNADNRISSVANVHIHGFFSATYAEETPGYTNTFVLTSADKTYFNTMPVRLLQGRLPENSGEIVVSEYIMSRMEKGEDSVELGDTISLEVNTAPDYFMGYGLQLGDNKQYTVSYTIVGVIEDISNITNLMVEAAFTLESDTTPEVLFHNAYVKTNDPADAYEVVSANYGSTTSINSDVLMLNGVTRYNNMNTLFVVVCIILVAIIMLGSVSLIYNAFSISVSERTKQFGLMTSIGATRRQIRHSVFFEAGALCLFAIPLGIICGWGGIAVVLHYLQDSIAELFFYGAYVPLVTVVSVPCVIGAVVTGTITVFISAWIPAIRSTKISPVSAIRQSNDYKATPKQVRVGKLTYLLFGLSGVMAKKYYSISKRKYRATVLSLAISVILFITASAFANGIRTATTATTSISYYDMVCFGLSQNQLEVLEELLQSDHIEEAVWIGQTTYDGMIPLDDANDDFLKYHQDNLTMIWTEGSDYLLPSISIQYIEDDVLEAWLIDEGIDPTPYLDSDNPLALVHELSTTIHTQDESGKTSRFVQYVYPVKDNVTELSLWDLDTSWMADNGITGRVSYYCVTGDGRYCIHAVPVEEDSFTDPYNQFADTSVGEYYVAELMGDEIYYYQYYPDSNTTENEPIATSPAGRTSIRLGARIKDMRYCDSTMDYHSIKLILPLSAMEDDSTMTVGINIKKGHAEAVREYLEGNDVPYNDHLASEQQVRGVLTVIDVFSYGFIILISLICIANVFNTISTNIALRRRDFGMLRSTGMQTRELYRMMNYECLIYGSKALLWGLPVSILISYGINRIFASMFTLTFTPPWAAMIIASGCVFLVVFTSMFYAVSKLRKDNPIDAIRMENA